MGLVIGLPDWQPLGAAQIESNGVVDVYVVGAGVEPGQGADQDHSANPEQELKSAAWKGDSSAVLAALAEGADVNASSTSSDTALYYAVAGKHVEIARLLVAHHADVFNDGDALLKAVESGDVELVKLLLDSGADPNRAKNGSLFVRVVANGNTTIIQLFLDAGADLSRFGGSALVAAVAKGNQPVVEALLDFGADPNATSVDYETAGDTALHAASGQGNVALVSLLLRRGADVNKRATQNASVLFQAMANGHDDVVSMLVEKGATVTATDLRSAISKGDVTLLRSTLAGFNPSASTDSDIELVYAAADLRGADFSKAVPERIPPRHVDDERVLLVYGQDTDAGCAISKWAPQNGQPTIVYRSGSECAALRTFVADDSATLTVVEDDHLVIIDLTGAGETRTVAMPTAQIQQKLTALVEHEARALRLQNPNTEPDLRWMNAAPSAVGRLDSGAVAMAISTVLPGDATATYLYLQSNDDTWTIESEKTCDRLDDHCGWSEIDGRGINAWRTEREVWHAFQRTNRFVSARKKTISDDGSASWTESLEFDLPTMPKLAYVAEWVSDDGGDYLRMPSLQLKRGQNVVLTCDNGCETSLAGKYLLLCKSYGPQRPKLVDLGTGEAPIENLTFASWVR